MAVLGVNVAINKKPRIVVSQNMLPTKNLGDLRDVDTSSKEDGSLLIYDEETGKFITSRLLEKQDINGGHY